jgi:hypothetical protein
VFGLQGYVTELLFTITTLLVERSLGNLRLRSFASNPNSGTRAGSIRCMLTLLERIVLMRALIIFIVTLYLQLFISATLLDCKRPRDRPYASARLVPHLTYDLYRAHGLGEVSVSPL